VIREALPDGARTYDSSRERNRMLIGTSTALDGFFSEFCSCYGSQHIRTTVVLTENLIRAGMSSEIG
jgi:hypothetical protein